MPLRRTDGGEIEDLLAVRTEHGEHGVCRLLLLCLLGVAVGTLQKAGVRMTYEVCHRLLVHTAVQKRCHEVVPQGVQVVLPRKADGGIDLPQPLGEGVRVDELTVFIGEEIGTEPAALLVRLHLLAAFVGEEDAPQVRGEADFTALAVLVLPSTMPLPGTLLRERLTVSSRPFCVPVKSDHCRAHSSPRRQPVYMESR